MATGDWLAKNPDTARKLTSAVMKAMSYMQEHPREEILSHVAQQYRTPDETLDLEALRVIIPMLSQSRTVSPAGAEVVKKALAASFDKVRTTSLDLSATYTNAFVNAR